MGFDALSFMPNFLAKILVKTGRGLLNALLDLNYQVSRAYTPNRFKQEMKGLSKGSGVSYRDIRRLNLFPEFIRAACTIAGVWGPATESNKLYQLRALDWDSEAPVVKYPAAVIYHSSEEGSQVFANIGFAGLIGTLSAQSNSGIGISEKIWWKPKAEKAHYSYLGKPWAYVLRDLAQFETTIQGAINTLNKTHRTMRIHIGIGSANDNSFRGVEYAHNMV
jgi:isopenicillin-N N-acyltransferase like protein